MTIDQIREQLVEKIISHYNWVDKLSDSDPGHYGLEDWDVQLKKENIWVEVPQGTFTFRKAKFDFELLLGSSSDGSKMSFSKEAKGEGSFSFSSNGNEIDIKELNIDFDLSLFDDK
jgi:hypothetical protein